MISAPDWRRGQLGAEKQLKGETEETLPGILFIYVFVILFSDKGAFGGICGTTMNQTASVSHQIECQPVKDIKVGLIFLSFHYVKVVSNLYQLLPLILKELSHF